MRVLLITGEFPPMQGGVGDYTSEIARRLAREHDLRVLTSRLAAGNPQAQVLPLVDKWEWSIIPLIRKQVGEFAPDIVDIQYQTGAYGMHPAINLLPRLLRLLPASRAPRPRFIVTFHDLRIPYLFPKAGPVRDWVTRELARSGDAVIATNPEDALKLLHWNIRPVSVIPIGSNISTTLPPGYDRSAWRARLGVAEDDILLCHFGFVNSRKGCDTLLRALAQIPVGKLLMIGGQTGASDPTNVTYMSEMQALIAELGLSSRVLWTGFTPPEVVTANFRAADLCVLPYREGASFRHGTLMAALAHGMPIVTTELPDVPAPPGSASLPPLRDGDNCLLVPPDDPAALAAAITRAIASPELRASLGQGACTVAAHFSWDYIVQQHLELFARLRRADLGV